MTVTGGANAALLSRIGSCSLPSPRRLLAVVPEADLREVIVTGLAMTTDWEAIATGSEAEALQLGIERQPDAIILNHAGAMMEPPLLLQLAATPATRRIPAILIVERARLADVQHYQRLGCAGIIAKPFDCIQLSQQIAEFLNWPLAT